MNARPLRLPRRRFLRGLAGATIALPFLESLTTHRADAGQFPKRLVIVFSANGTIADAWRPTGTETDFTLGEILEPLAPHQDSLLILRGIDVESSYHGPGDNSHMSAMGHMLTGVPMIDLGQSVYWGGGISVDQFIAQHIGQTTKLPSLELCVENNPPTVSSRMSYLGPVQPVPPEPDPARVYDRLFGVIPHDLRQKRQSVLDAVGEDLGDLEARLGAADRQKVHAHLEAVRGIEKRLFIPDPSLSCAGGIDLGRYALNDVPAIGKEQMDLLVLALACDLTRVVTLQWSQAVSMTRMGWLGIKEAHHDISHMDPKDPTVRSRLVAINRWYATQFAYLLAAMKAVPEGQGTLLDHSLVLWLNELNDGEVHSRRDMNYVAAGSAGGAIKTGRYVQYLGSNRPPHSNLLVSICQAMDVDVKTFGDPLYCQGPLAKFTG